MTKIVISDEMKRELQKFLKVHPKADLITTYFFFLEKRYDLKPVIFLREKTIYQSQKELLQKLESEGKIWKETEIKIQFGPQGVNEYTKKIYICPFSGKVFGDNTNPNPQDAIYDWVSRCPENNEYIGGLKVKRFFVSEDPEVIKNYTVKRKEPIKKIVFSSALTGKLFNSKESVLQDFLETQLKAIPLAEVPNQNRFKIEDNFLAFIQEYLDESKINEFIEALSEEKSFSSFISRWLE